MFVNKPILSAHFSDLPIEIVTFILDLLPYSDLKDARVVCKQWYTISQDTQIAKQEIVCMKGKKVDPAKLINSERVFQHLNIETKNSIWANEEFWANVGSKLKSLTVAACEIHEGKFLKALSYCVHLQILELKYFVCLQRAWPIVLPELEFKDIHTLKITEVEKLDTLLCDTIVSKSPKLKTLFLDCTVEFLTVSFFGQEISSYFLPILNYVTQSPHLTFDVTLTYLKTTRKETALFKKLVALPNVRLHGLLTSDKNAYKYLSSHKNLEVLELRRENVDTGAITFICNELQNLKVFAISSCLKINASFHNLALLENLTTLEIWSCYKDTNISENGVEILKQHDFKFRRSFHWGNNDSDRGSCCSLDLSIYPSCSRDNERSTNQIGNRQSVQSNNQPENLTINNDHGDDNDSERQSDNHGDNNSERHNDSHCNNNSERRSDNGHSDSSSERDGGTGNHSDRDVERLGDDHSTSHSDTESDSDDDGRNNFPADKYRYSDDYDDSSIDS